MICKDERGAQAAIRKCVIIEGQMTQLIDSSADEMKAEVIRVGREISKERTQKSV